MVVTLVQQVFIPAVIYGVQLKLHWRVWIFPKQRLPDRVPPPTELRSGRRDGVRAAPWSNRPCRPYIYTHSNLKAQEQIETASKAVLNLRPENPQNEPCMKLQNAKKDITSMSEQDKKLYEMYLELKEKFE